MRFLIVIICILSAISIANSQTSYYKKGRAIVNDVKVLYQPDNRSYYSCKIETNEGIIEFGPKDIDEYQRRYGNVFVSYDLGEGHFAFLERIEEGHMSLYYLVDRDYQKRYFIQDANGSISELLERARRGQKDYKDVLRELWTECDMYSEMLEKMEFNLQSIKRMVGTHNNCKEPYTPETKKRLSVSLGYIQLQRSVSSSAVTAIPAGTLELFDISNKLNYQLAYTLERPLTSSNVSFLLGLRLSKFNFFQRDVISLGTLEYEMDINTLDLGLITGLNYTHAADKIRPYFSVQLVPSYLIMNDVALSRITFDPVTRSNVTESTDTGPTAFGISGRLGGGMQYDINNSIEFSLELGYDHRLSIGSSRVFNYTGPYFGLGIRYKKEDKQKSRPSRRTRSTR